MPDCGRYTLRNCQSFENMKQLVAAEATDFYWEFCVTFYLLVKNFETETPYY